MNSMNREKPNFDGVCLPTSLWPVVLRAAEIGPENMDQRFKKSGIDIYNLKGLYKCPECMDKKAIS